MGNNYSDDQLRLIARLYYIDGVGQQEVARFAKVSQAQVSRLLTIARERGIVRITVADYDPRRRDLEDALRARFGLNTAVVIKAMDSLAPADLRRAIGHFGAEAVAALLDTNTVVALAGGRTIHELVHHLPEARHQGLTVVQAMGSVDASVSAFDAQEVGRGMAQRLGGTFLSLNSPAYFPERKTRDAMLKLPQVRAVLRHLDEAQVALVGVGTLENSVFAERGVLEPAAVAELRKAGAVGEICGRFFAADGAECDTDWGDRVMSVSLAQLRRIPDVVAIVSGSDRTAALVAALRGRMVKSLVIDDAGAAALLASPVNTKPPAPKAK